MNKPKFTPGPWKANIYDRAMGDTGDYYTERTVESPLNICVCQCFEHDNNEHTGEEEADANAHLIAAAPEMYNALVAVSVILNMVMSVNCGACGNYCSGEREKNDCAGGDVARALDKANYALKKARGES